MKSIEGKLIRKKERKKERKNEEEKKKRWEWTEREKKKTENHEGKKRREKNFYCERRMLYISRTFFFTFMLTLVYIFPLTSCPCAFIWNRVCFPTLNLTPTPSLFVAMIGSKNTSIPQKFEKSNNNQNKENKGNVVMLIKQMFIWQEITRKAFWRSPCICWKCWFGSRIILENNESWYINGLLLQLCDLLVCRQSEGYICQVAKES